MKQCLFATFFALALIAPSFASANPEPTTYDSRSIGMGLTGTSYLEAPAALTINPVNDNAPDAGADFTATVAEESANGTLVGTVSATDIALPHFGPFDLDGNPCSANEQGEICVAGPAVFAGYYDNEIANRQAFRDGFFRTGDLNPTCCATPWGTNWSAKSATHGS